MKEPRIIICSWTDVINGTVNVTNTISLKEALARERKTCEELKAREALARQKESEYWSFFDDEEQT